MKINGKITFTYNNDKNAQIVFDSLDIDNENYLKSKINKNNLEYVIESEKLGTYLSTVDDLIASEIVVEKIVEKIK